MRETEVQIGNSGLIAKPWLTLDDVLKANEGGKSMFHLIWYVLIGLIAGFIAKSVMHVHMTSSRRPHFFHTGRDPGSLHLL